MRVVATYNIKGGVGKTSAAVNVGYLAARDGLRTLIWDLDPQGSATYLFRVKPKVKGGGKALVAGRRTLDEAIKETDFDRLDLMPADFSYRNLDLDLDSTKRPTDRLRRLVAPLDDEYELVILDCPPSASLVSENVVRASHVLLVPLIPAVLSLRTFDQLTDFVDGLPGRTPTVMFPLILRSDAGSTGTWYLPICALPSTALASIRFIWGDPMKPATKRLTGLS